ncbi:LOW QUALITY PROTEIN: hypothetical protein V2J09_011993 [Rumex salicifolius]
MSDVASSRAMYRLRTVRTSRQRSSKAQNGKFCYNDGNAEFSVSTSKTSLSRFLFNLLLCSSNLPSFCSNQAIHGYSRLQYDNADFTAALLFRILLTVELRLASGMGLDLFGEHVHYCARAVVLSAVYMIFYPFLWAWNTIGFVWWFTSSEKDWLPGSGLICCYFIFLLICFYELFRFASSSVEKHIAAQRLLTPVLRADKGIPISKNKLHNLGPPVGHDCPSKLLLLLRVLQFQLSQTQSLTDASMQSQTRRAKAATTTMQQPQQSTAPPILKEIMWPESRRQTRTPVDDSTGSSFRPEAPVKPSSPYSMAGGGDGGNAVVAVETYYSPLQSPLPVTPPTDSNTPENVHAGVTSSSLVLSLGRIVSEKTASSALVVGPVAGGGESGGVFWFGKWKKKKKEGVVEEIVSRSRKKGMVMRAALGLRVYEFVLSLISFVVMAADNTQGWSGDSFYRYKEYKYCLSILAYLLISASSAAATRVDEWQTNWGKDEFTEKASISTTMSFLAFIGFALSSAISGHNLCNRDFT